MGQDNLVLLALSGKQASGKDTIGSAVMQRLDIPHTKISLASALRREIDEILTHLRNAITHTDLAYRLNAPLHAAKEISSILAPAVDDPSITSHSRTPEIRKALQHWGTEVRKQQDDAYFLKLLSTEIEYNISNNISMYCTDTRFESEADFLKSFGFTTVRLEIPQDVQKTRIYLRDGIIVSDDALQHSSETGLDNYSHFDLVLDATNHIDDNVKKVVQALKSPLSIK